MEKIKKIVLACSIDDELLGHLEQINRFPWSEETEFHFVHIFKVQIMVNEFTPYIYPDEDQKKAISDFVSKHLTNLKNKICPGHDRSVEKCLFDTNPKKRMLEYLDEVNADLVTVSTRGKHGIEGLFTSSFTDYLIKFAKCDVLVLRP